MPRRSVLLVGAAALLISCSSSSDDDASSTSTSEAAASTTSTTAAAGTATASRLIDTPSGTQIEVRPPLDHPEHSAPVTYADPSSLPAGESFAAGPTANGVPLEELGPWTAPPAGVTTTTTRPSASGSSTTGSSTTTGAGSSSTTAGSSGADATTTTIPADETGAAEMLSGSSADLCAGQPASTNCQVFSTGWVRLAHDAGTEGSFSCPPQAPYNLGTWSGPNVGSSDEPGASGNFTGSWGWTRDHWTITVWATPFVSDPPQGVRFSAQNWNTIWGDAWHYQVMLPCGTSPTPPPSN